MQPTYLPWAGYFNLAVNVDVFVILDDVQFARRSWQNRNRILVDGSELHLTVPVKKCARSTEIRNVEISDHEAWWRYHWDRLCHGYSDTLHGAELLGVLKDVYAQPIKGRLFDLNLKLIRIFFELLNISARLVIASELGCEGSRSEHLYRIAKAVGCNEYLSPIGSSDYLAVDGFEDLPDISLFFQRYSPPSYPQHESVKFTPNLSIVDVIANLGVVDTKLYITGLFKN